ncbi:hypothetical protein ACERZ8_09535 [Tateyamaria armeniaca]|uniref:Uncharacterized protein n=1 Tax=Tateyamaria armeniaca TaxID=2518930 RepID=A0ABW8UVX2_9RHOB
MSIKINRIKLRIPAGMAGTPEGFARSFAARLAQQTSTASAPLDTVRVRVPQTKGDPAGTVARAVGRAIQNRGKD